MKKNKRSFEEKLPLLLAFALPILIMLGIFAGKEIYPFGNRCFLRTDLYHQYVAFFENFAERVRNGQSLSYAWEIGLGSNYLALFAYYLSGPMQLLAFLIPEGSIIEFITALIVLKIGLCGLSMAWYLSKRFNTRHIGITFCGVCYALSGYMAAYSWNVMWLDVLWLTPVVLYGLELLVEKNKPFLYCISLGLAILCNYYIGIMLCIFLVFYFICRMLCLPEKTPFKQYLLKIFNFGLFSLLAGALAAVLIVPAAFALQGTASADSSFPKKIQNYFALLEMLARHMVVVDVETGLNHWPNLYCGVGVFLLVPMYFMNRDVHFKEKMANILMVGFMLLGFNTNALNFIWHGLHYPNSLPCRQSFLYNFVLLVMCFEGIRALPKLPKGKLLGTMWGSIALIMILEVICDPEEIPYYACYATILFICLYAFVFYLHKVRKADSVTAAALGICLLIIEMGLNTAVTSVSTVDRSEFTRYDKSYDELIAATGEPEGSFYRMERNSLRTKNDGPYFGYRSASIFSSTTYAKISNLYKKIGLEGNTNAYAFNGATPLIHSLLSVKYRISDTKLPDSPLYQEKASALDAKMGISYLYENTYTLPLGFLVPADMPELWTMSGNPIKVQNSFVNLSTGLGNVLNSVSTKTEGTVLTATAPEDAFYFAYTSGVTKVTASVDGAGSRVWDCVNRGYLVNFGYCKAGSELKLVNSESGNISGTVYRFDSDLFIEAYERLTAQPFTITEWSDTRKLTQIKGTVTAEESACLMFSIPYDEGWKATVDGQQVAPISIAAGSLLALQLPAGSHEIAISYTAKGASLGLWISLAALALLLLIALLLFVLRSLKARRSEEEEQEEDLLAAAPGKERMERLRELDAQERERDGLTEEAGTHLQKGNSPAEKRREQQLLELENETNVGDRLIQELNTDEAVPAAKTAEKLKEAADEALKETAGAANEAAAAQVPEGFTLLTDSAEDTPADKQ